MSYKINLKNFFIYVFVFWYSTEILFNCNLNSIWGVPIRKISNVTAWVVFALLLVQILFFQTYTKRELIIITVITLPIVIATVLSGQRSIMSTWMFIVAAKRVDFEHIIQVAYKVLLIMMPIIILLCLSGVIDNRVLMRGSVRRFSLGFSHPNQLGLRIFQLVACYCYVHKNKNGIRSYIYIFLATIFLIRVPNSQAAYITTGTFLFMLLLYIYLIEQRAIYFELYNKGMLFGTFFLSFFSVLFSGINVNNYYFLMKLDNWLSSRFSVCHKVWLMYGVSFFGQRIYVTEEERKLVGIKSPLWLDNAYMSILLRYGILIFLIFCMSYLYLIKVTEKQKNHVLVIILFLYALYGTIETGLYMITHNIFLIAFSALLYGKPLGIEELRPEMAKMENFEE